MKTLVAILHDLRDGLLRAVTALERDDDMAALHELEQAAERVRATIDEIRRAA